MMNGSAIAAFHFYKDCADFPLFILEGDPFGEPADKPVIIQKAFNNVGIRRCGKCDEFRQLLGPSELCIACESIMNARDGSDNTITTTRIKNKLKMNKWLREEELYPIQ